MTNHNKGSLADQPVSKLFWRYTLPAVAGMLVNGLYSTIDGIFIGQAVGAEGLAAMNTIWPIFGVILGIGLMFGMGAAALYSIARGEQKLDKAREILGNSVVLMALTSVVLGAIVYHYGHYGLRWMGAEGSILAMGQEYLRYIGLGTLAALMGAALPMMVRNDERPHLSTIQQISHDLKVGLFVASGFSPGRLYHRVQAFQKPIINLTVLPLNNTIPVSPDCFSCLDDRLQAAVSSPEVPFLEP